MTLRVGWFSTGRGEGSRRLLTAAVDAIRESFRLTRGLEGTILGIIVAGLLASGLGLAMLGLGLVPALIWWDLAMASLYHAEVLPSSEPPELGVFAEPFPT